MAILNELFDENHSFGKAGELNSMDKGHLKSPGLCTMKQLTVALQILAVFANENNSQDLASQLKILNF